MKKKQGDVRREEIVEGMINEKTLELLIPCKIR